MTTRSIPVALTDDERKAILALGRVARHWPKTLWLFAGPGNLYVLRKNADGSRAMTPDGAFDQSSVVATILGIEAEGGDW